MRSVILITLVALLCAPLAANAEVLVSTCSHEFHRPDCILVQKLGPKGLIVFKSHEEALKAGYIQCKICRPALAQTKPGDKGRDRSPHIEPSRLEGKYLILHLLFSMQKF